MEKKLERIEDILLETEDFKEAMILACGALAKVLAQGDPKLDSEALEFVIDSLKKLIPAYREEMAEQESKKDEIFKNLNRDLMDENISIEEIADKYCTFGNDELRQHTIEELREMRISLFEKE
jgi:hypothetical protein